MEVSGELHGPATLPPGKEPLVRTVYEAEWAQRWSEGSGEEIKKLSSCPESNTGRLARSLITVLTGLSRLLH
jgi:hypothetical protein